MQRFACSKLAFSLILVLVSSFIFCNLPLFGRAISNFLVSDSDSNYKLYHLVKPSEHGPSDLQDKMVTEIYLTRFIFLYYLIYTTCLFRKKRYIYFAKLRKEIDFVICFV